MPALHRPLTGVPGGQTGARGDLNGKQGKNQEPACGSTAAQFFKISAAGLGGSGLAVLGMAPEAARAEVRQYKLYRATETRNNCTYCSVGCGILIYSLGDGAKNAQKKIIHVEGDPDHPVSRGSLCPKGAGVLDYIHSAQRLKYPEVREAGSNEWKRITWDEANERIARLIKDDRDANFIEKNAAGATVNRWLSTGFLGSSAASNETGFLDFKVRTRPRHCVGRKPGPSLSRPDGVGTGAVLRARRDDQSLGGHQERQRDSGHGRQSGRSPPGRFQVGRSRQRRATTPR